MQIAFLIYEGLTALDIIGPYEVFNQIPDVDVRFVAKQPGSIRVDSGAFSIGVDHKLTDVPRPDVFVVPGGVAGTFAAAKDPEILNWVREADAGSRYSTSVCTGSLILGAAGLEGFECHNSLGGKDVPRTNWSHLHRGARRRRGKDHYCSRRFRRNRHGALRDG